MSINPAALKAALSGDLENAIVASTPGGIEAQEAAGQQTLVTSTDMPIDLERTLFERLGFVFGEAIDDIFQKATLPLGWTRKPSDHSMWSYIHDERDRRRVSVFYKAAFYDRGAHATLDRRYGCGTDYNKKRDEMTSSVVTDYGDSEKILASFGCYAFKDFEADQKYNAEAVSWLNKHFPNWGDATAYW